MSMTSLELHQYTKQLAMARQELRHLALPMNATGKGGGQGRGGGRNAAWSCLSWGKRVSVLLLTT